jgi:hypothetical protein
MICAVGGTIIGIGLFGLGSSVRAAKTRGAIAQLKDHVANARELSISQQRDIRIEFIAPDQIRVTRINRPAAAGTTVLVDMRLEGGMTFTKLPGMPETPDPWGGATAVAFGGATSLRFRAGDGALIDQTDNTVNGRIFLAHDSGRVDSAGVISVFGPTGRIRAYRLAGGSWN